MNKALFDRIKNLLENANVLYPEKETGLNFSEAIILITGAAGTIGSGIARQLISGPFKTLILLDNAETPLYYLQKEMERIQTNAVHFIVADIRDEEAMNHIFKSHKPTIVFHTAAYKHVPLMESNSYEAVKVNVLGTKTLADLALKYHTKKLVFISTDKAANPINVMGMTKWIAEQYLNSLNVLNQTRFLITRFGNVLDSNGSLLPVFKRQIKNQQAITITHKHVCRYFINKQRACSLILKIASHDHWNHAVFTFNMGTPIKIVDLAHVFIQIQNLKPNTDVAITFIGLRPGEKLKEDLIAHTEITILTEYRDIWYIIPKQIKEQATFNLEPLQNIKAFQSNSDIKRVLSNFCRESL